MRYSRRRNVRNFWKNPLVNLCYTLAVLAFVAGLFGFCAYFGGANCFLFSAAAISSGFLLIALGNKINARKKQQAQESEPSEN